MKSQVESQVPLVEYTRQEINEVLQLLKFSEVYQAIFQKNSAQKALPSLPD